MHIGIAKMRNHGEIITFTIIAEPQRRTKNISRWIDMDIFFNKKIDKFTVLSDYYYIIDYLIFLLNMDLINDAYIGAKSV